MKKKSFTIITILLVLAVVTTGGLLYSNHTQKEAQISALNAEVSDKSVRIESLDADVADKAAQIEDLNADVADKAAQIESLNADVADKAAQIESLNADVADKAAQIESLNADVADKVAQIKSLNADVAGKAVQIESLNADVADKAVQIEELNADVYIKTAQIEKMNEDVAKKAEQIIGLNTELASKSTQISELNAEVAARTAQIDALDAEAETWSVLIEETKADVDAKAAQIEVLNADIADKTSQVEALKAELEDRLAQIETLNADTVSKNDEIEALNATIAEQAALIETLKAGASATAEQVQGKESEYNQNGELTYVKTEWGNYYFGITKAVILPKTSYRNAVYQISWECQNENFKPSNGNMLGISEYDLTVIDSNGYRVSPMQTGWDGDWLNSYATVAPGQKCVITHTFIINEPSCEYLDITLDARGVKKRIYIEKAADAEKEKDQTVLSSLNLGEPVTITGSNGSYIFSLDNAHAVEWRRATEDRPGTKIVTLQGIVQNVDYERLYDGYISTYEVASGGLVVEDQDGFALEFYNISGGDDGLYEVGARVQKGTKKRVSLPYYAPSSCNSLIVTVGDKGVIEIPLR